MARTKKKRRRTNQRNAPHAAALEPQESAIRTSIEQFCSAFAANFGYQLAGVYLKVGADSPSFLMSNPATFPQRAELLIRVVQKFSSADPEMGKRTFDGVRLVANFVESELEVGGSSFEIHGYFLPSIESSVGGHRPLVFGCLTRSFSLQIRSLALRLLRRTSLVTYLQSLWALVEAAVHETRASHLSRLTREIQESLGANRGPNGLIERLQEIANSFVGSRVGFIFTFDKQANSLIFYRGYNCSFADLELPILSIEGSASGQAITQRHMVDFDRILDDDPYLCKRFASRNQVTRYLVAPLFNTLGEVVGVIGTHPPPGRTFTPREFRRYQGICRLIGLAMELARRWRRENQLKSLITMGSILKEGSEEDAIRKVMASIRETLQVEQVIYLASGDSNRRIITGPRNPKPILGDTELRRLAQESSKRQIPSFIRVPSDSHEPSPFERLAFVSASAVFVKGDFRGLLVVIDTVSGYESKKIPLLSEDHVFIRSVAEVLGIHLDNFEFVKSLREEERRREALTVSLAHEVLNPLSGLRSRLVALRESFEPSTAELDRKRPPFIYFNDMLETFDDIDALTSSILSLTNDDCKLERSFLFKHVFIKVYDIVKGEAARRKLRIEFSEEEFFRYFPEINLDRTLAKHALYNVMKNAIKYSHRESVITIRLGTRDRLSTLSVENFGIGIPEGETEVIFEPFRQGSNAHFASVRGAGLGLYVTRRVMELHRGRIILARRNDPTIFTLEFPN